MKIQALNGKDDQLTLAALKTAASKATGKARATIQGLIQSLSPQPAARGRSAKKELLVKKHQKKRATKKAHKHNPTAAPKAYPVKTWHKKHNPTKASSGFGGKLNTGAILEVVKEGGLVALGALGSSFIERQSERILPDLNPSLRTLGATVVLAGGALYFGGKAYGKNIAVGAIAEGIRSLGRTFMPGVFAGTEDEYEQVSGVEGYWDENDQWIASGGDLAGLAYTLNDPAPAMAIRPIGF